MYLHAVAFFYMVLNFLLASCGISSGRSCIGTGGSGEGREECAASPQQSPGEQRDATR